MPASPAIYDVVHFLKMLFELTRKERLRAVAIGIRNIAIGGNFRSVSKIGDPTKLALYCTQTLFIFDSFFRRGLPHRNVRDVLSSKGREDLSIFLDCEEFWINDMPSAAADLLSLCLLTRLLQPKRIFEIGTYKGYMSLHFAANAPEAEVFTLDLPTNDAATLPITTMDEQLTAVPKGTAFQHRKEARRIHQLYGDSAQFDFSPYEQNIDLFFIDGAHTYEYVRNDTQKALQCCRSGSVIAWHDYGRSGVNGVSRWLHEFAPIARFPIYRVPNSCLAFGVVAS